MIGSQHIILCQLQLDSPKENAELSWIKKNLKDFLKRKKNQRERKESKQAEEMLKCVKSFLVFYSVGKIIVSGFAPRLFKLLMEEEKA